MNGTAVIKKKVKEIKLKVVAMKVMLERIPVGKERESKLKNIYIRETASASEIERKLHDELGWDSSLWMLKYMYVCGRYLRPASLEDVEHADTWDVSALRALMGGGCLYVSRIARDDISKCSDTEKMVSSALLTCLLA